MQDFKASSMLTRSKSVKDYRVSQGEHVWRATMRNERNAGHAHTLRTRAKQDGRVRRSVRYESFMGWFSEIAPSPVASRKWFNACMVQVPLAIEQSGERLNSGDHDGAKPWDVGCALNQATVSSDDASDTKTRKAARQLDAEERGDASVHPSRLVPPVKLPASSRW
ncbi:hypothetical protein BDA99DRAFT_560766 [Phascolomyces articulosus]|uniref:Uncharacterized protein n=1 Tax=Phascolomyces articulosus TaxID=60185 RepID=A0AAD5PCW8_9FUNG|nr:hypothetical protein BDA99DRAFT_560766 [Phascolomyces articulosus]